MNSRLSIPHTTRASHQLSNMHFIQRAFLLAAVTSIVVLVAPKAVADVVPADTIPNTHTPLSTASSSTPALSTRQDLPEIKWAGKKCGCNRHLDKTQTDAVTDALAKNISNAEGGVWRLPPGQEHLEWSENGEMMAFIINRAEHLTIQLTESIFREWITGKLGGTCGLYTAGTSGTFNMPAPDSGYFGAGYMLKSNWNPKDPRNSMFGSVAEKCPWY